MKLRIDRHGEHVHLTARGDLDAHVRDAFLEAALALLDEGASNLTLDLRRVGYLTSSGVGALIRLRSAAERAGGSLIVLWASEAVIDTLGSLGLAEHLLGPRLGRPLDVGVGAL